MKLAAPDSHLFCPQAPPSRTMHDTYDDLMVTAVDEAMRTVGRDELIRFVGVIAAEGGGDATSELVF